MELIPESLRADDWFGPFLVDDQDLLEQLTTLGHQVVALVPDCVGLSVSMIEHGVTFTTAGRGPVTKLLDAVQYVDDGPCLTAMDAGAVVAWSDTDVEDPERAWHAFARATSSVGVASSLSLPVMRAGVVIGGFNLYASSDHAFDGHHETLADLLGAWAPGATTNADLDFTTLDLARRAPELLRESTDLVVASAALARLLGCGGTEATERLRRAAFQSSLPLPVLASSIIAMLGED